MRALVQRPLGFAVIGLAAVFSGQGRAQSDSVADDARVTNPTEQPEEITVRGRKTLTQYRLVNALTASSGQCITNTRRAPPPPGGPQVNAAIGTGVAQGDEVAGSADSRAKIEELERLQRENRRLYRAALKYVELEDEYNGAHKELGE